MTNVQEILAIWEVEASEQYRRISDKSFIGPRTAISEVSMSKLPIKVKALLNKASESALLAVEVYNKPATTFRSGGFVVLITIAWTALFHAIFEKTEIKYYYRENKNPRRYQKIDGDYKAWELSTCLKEYYGSTNNAVKSNLEFIIGIRNKVEHRFMPELDENIFGECQACLLNFEDLLVQEFGESYAINENLVFALQFSAKRKEQQKKAGRKLHSKEFEDVKDYIERFRSSLPEEIKNDLDYSFKVFLIPKVGNHKNSSDVSIEFIKYDPTNPDEMKKYEKIIALVKEKQIPILNLNLLKPSIVAERVSTALGKPFNASAHHVKCWKHFRIRPSTGASNPAKTDPKYCHYDSAHKDYLYTEEWVTLLIKELSDEDNFQNIIGT